MTINYTEINRRLLIATQLVITIQKCEDYLNQTLSSSKHVSQDSSSPNLNSLGHFQSTFDAPSSTLDTISNIGPRQVSSRIKKLRVDKGLRQIDLSKITGIARPNIARLESGRRMPNLATLVKIADALGVPIQSFLNAEI